MIGYVLSEVEANKDLRGSSDIMSSKMIEYVLFIVEADKTYEVIAFISYHTQRQ
jgi:hypothetical protein